MRTDFDSFAGSTPTVRMKVNRPPPICLQSAHESLLMLLGKGNVLFQQCQDVPCLKSAFTERIDQDAMREVKSALLFFCLSYNVSHSERTGSVGSIIVQFLQSRPQGVCVGIHA